ncbi:MAG: GNAT family N-acetyltransferase [Flavobacteriaceae bacterium]
MLNSYLFTSSRLGFRNWILEDVDPLHLMCTDKEVMEFFPDIWSLKQTDQFIKRMQQSFVDNGYCCFAVDILKSKEFIGFIGLSLQTFEAEFTPCVDIGWRLKKSAWKKGFATEGAKACLDFAFKKLNLKSVVAIAPELNQKSQQVMKKIGMIKSISFSHPAIKGGNPLNKCVLFKISK